MKKLTLFIVGAIVLATGATVTTGSARGEPVEEFYSGKTIDLIIGFSVGGGYDRYARVLARHMSQYIPGNPTIVPRNMPGAGSLVAANYLFNAAPQDGTAIGTFSRGIPFAPLLVGEDGIEFEADRFNWLGSINNEVNICVSWHTSEVKSWEQLRTTELIAGAAQPGGESHTYALVLNNILGARMRLVPGYPGSSEMLLAMERGEVDGFCGWSWGSAKSGKPEWFRDGKVNILVQMALEKHPDLPDVPLVMDLAETDEQRQALQLILARQTVGRPYAAPPGVPEERVEALRDAFLATLRDPDFLAEAQQANLEVNPVSGAAVSELLVSVYQTPEEIVASAREAIRP